VRDLGDSELSLRDIADLLGVQYILEGSVRSAGNQVRVNVTLVDVASEETMWGAQYDEEVTPENLLEIQGKISRQVIEELEARLTPEEDAALASMRPAASSVAQQWFYRGIEAFTASPEGARQARDAMRRAVESDSGYLAAWSELAKFESRLAWIGEDRLSEARAAMERTESLAPGSAEAHLARGYFEYYARRNFDAALSAFRAAERLAPSDADAKVAVGLILRRQGQWEASTEAMKVGVQLDPRNIDPVQFLAENLAFVGAYEAADAVIERALTVDPADPEIRAYKIRNLIHLDRDAGRARRLADELALDPDELEEAGVLAGLAALAGDYERSLTSFDRWQRPEADLVQVGRSLHRARTFLFMEDPASARAAADTALMLIDEIPLEGRLGTTFRGWAHAMAGRREAAMPLLREAEREIRSWEDHVDPTTRALEVVDAYGLLGEIDRGIGLLEELIDRPAVNFSVSRLLLDPALEPYRGDPRFAELIERRERFEADAAEWAEASGAWLPSR
jgi:tetratricopeptide (TPR) repeat protein